MEVPTTVSSTLGRGHRIIPGVFGGHAYADGYAYPHPGEAPLVKITVKDDTDLAMLYFTPACARELALQLMDSAAFCDDVARKQRSQDIEAAHYVGEPR